MEEEVMGEQEEDRVLSRCCWSRSSSLRLQLQNLFQWK